MRRSTVIAGTVAGAVLVAAVSFLAVKVRAVAQAAEDAVLAQTGHRFTYSGLPGISFWPETAVTLGDVTIPSAGGGDVPLATAGAMRLSLDRSLFATSDPAIRSITLGDSVINMNVGQDGKCGWVFEGSNQAPSAAAATPIRITNGRLQFHDHRSGFAFAMDEIEADATLAGRDGEFTAKGGLVWNKQPVNFTLFLKSLRRLCEDGSPIDLNISSPSLLLALSGRAATAKRFDLTGQATARSADLRQLALWLGSPLSGERGLGKFEISGLFEASERAITFRKAKLAMDAMRGQGDVGLTRKEGRAKVSANLGIDRIDLNAYRAGEPRVRPLTLLEDRWSTDTLTFRALRDIDVSLTVAANEIHHGDLRTGPARLAAELKGGVLDLRLDDLSLYGGTAAAQIRLDGTEAVPSLAVAFSGSNLDSEQALRGAISFGKIAGRMATSFSVTATGSSSSEMVSRLKGSGSFRFTQGSVKDLDLSSIVRRTTEAITEGWPLDPAAATAFDALSASYTVEDGIVTTQNLVLASPVLAITSRGEIDLARQTFDLASDPRLAAPTKGRAGEFATLPVPLVVKGSWLGPRIYPDMPGILEDPQAAFRALKKLGMGTATIEPGAAAPAN